MTIKDLTAERVRFMFDFNPQTGDLTWRNPTSNNVHVGQMAGSMQQNGRKYIKIDGSLRLAHRVAWLHYHGELPEGDIAAKNGDYTDLRIDNLAFQSKSQTSSKGRRSTNTSGVKGVSWDAEKKKWLASITRNYKQLHLGRYDTKEEAAAAYERAARETHLGVPLDDRTHRVSRIARRAAVRGLWRKVARDFSGAGWSSFDEFAADVAPLNPSRHATIVQADTAAPIGPGNFRIDEGVRRTSYRTPEQKRAYDRSHRATNRDHYKNKELIKAFGITLEEYVRMFERQNGVCAICKKPETEVRRGKLQTLSVDHCHTTNRVRALLCGYCNRAIGYMSDSPNRLRAAADYVEDHASRIEHEIKTGLASNVIPLKKER